MHIRKAAIEDIELIYQTEIECFDTPWTYNMFVDEIINNDKASYYVIEYNSEIVGYAGYWHILDEAHITNIAIRPKFQNRGMGKKIINYLLNIFRNENIDKATLEVGTNNTAAKKLYKSAGFIVEGTRKKYYNNCEDALIMWKAGICDDTNKE